MALVSTLTSVSPAQPYIFRNYEYSSRSGDINRLGSSSHEIWQAVRASSGESFVPLLLVMQYICMYLDTHLTTLIFCSGYILS